LPTETADPAGATRRVLRKASVFQLVFLTYSVMCSGAYGLEEMVSSTGPGLTLVVLALLPIVWAAPISLAVAELAARHPVEGGYYRWARLGFGDRVGYLAAWLAWLTMFSTNAAFAVLFASYLRHFVPGLTPLAHFAVAAGLVWVATALNYRGIRLVGTTSVVLTVLIFVPFFLLTLIGLLRWQFNPFEPFVHPDKTAAAAFGDGLFVALWLYGGFEKMTVSAEEVEDPRRAFPIALGFAVPMTALSYVLPTLAALAANGDWAAWSEAHFGAAATAVGGPWLGAAMAAGGLASNTCLLMVTILGQSRLPMVLADDGLFPPVFRRTHPRFGSPVPALLLGAVVLTMLCGLRFSQLAGVYALVQALAYMLIYATLFRLRARGVGGEHGFRIPLGRRGLALMVAPGVMLAAALVVRGLWHDGAFDTQQALIDLAIFASGPLTYWLFRRPGTAAAAAPPASETA
jgi:amino acid transporter